MKKIGLFLMMLMTSVMIFAQNDVKKVSLAKAPKAQSVALSQKKQLKSASTMEKFDTKKATTTTTKSTTKTSTAKKSTTKTKKFQKKNKKAVKKNAKVTAQLKK